MTLITGGLIAAASANLLLGVIVAMRGWRRLSNLLFLLVCVFIAAWNIELAIFVGSSAADESLLMLVNLYYLTALGIALSLYVFTMAWLQLKHVRRTVVMCACLFGLWGLLIALFPEAIALGVYHEGDSISLQYSVAGQFAYSFTFLSFFTLSVLRLLFTRRRGGALKAQQARYMAVGIAAAGLIGVLFNLVLPWFGNDSFIWVGPQFSVLFVGAVAYLIAKHRLFDIRAKFALSIAYVFSLVTIGLVYASVLTVIGEFLHEEDMITRTQMLFFVAIAVLSAVAFPRVKSFFDKVTGRIFYQNTYDAESFLDQLNGVLVSSTELNELFARVSKLMNDNLKASFTTFMLETNFTKVTSSAYTMASTEDAELTEQLSVYKQPVIVVDNITINERSGRLVSVLDRHHIAAAYRLETGTQRVGYLLIGNKNSGSEYTPQDIKFIGLVANELAIAMQNVQRLEEISAFNETLQQKVAEATKQLRRSNAQLKALDATKDEFISMASHQLRTPLTSVKGYLSLVIDGDAGEISDTQRKLLTQAFVSSQRMVYLIADLLNVSRLKTGKFVLDTVPTDLAELAGEELEQLRESAEARGLSLVLETLNTTGAAPKLQLDETKIRQVIMNFIDNAVYYTPKGGTITVSVRVRSKSVELRVTDQGMGVPKTEQKHLFTKFYRAENAQRARPDGTGLGLYMAKKVIIAHHGVIIFTSHEGQGSTFGFSLPLTLKADELTKT